LAKDRAAPFSRKHRRTWITVTGGMLVICFLNVVVGLCSYKSEPKEPPQRIVLELPGRDAGPAIPGAIELAQIPGAVMRTFAVTYPRTIPAGAIRQERADGVVFVLTFPPGGAHHHATFRQDGTELAVD
jgi:hypothetical protein